jgi:hypothetical protein
MATGHSKPERVTTWTQVLQQGGTMLSFFKSYYVNDTAFILLSRGELSLSMFWTDYSHSKNEDSITEASD